MRLLKLKRVLVAVDLDDTSAAALRTAARLAALAEARLDLLHVTDRPSADDEARLLRRFRAAAPEAAAPDEIRVMAGDASQVIVQQAALREADVVILGPHRRGPGADGELGSTAASVVVDAACPCLITATELHLPLEQVIAAIDGSEAAAGVLGVALSWATALRSRSAELRLAAFHVSSEPADAAERWVWGEVRRARDRAGGAPHVDIRESVRSGSEPAAEILAQASSGADLLVMGTRGERPSPRMGSVSAAVVRAAPCPLLLVPPAVWLQESPGPG